MSCWKLYLCTSVTWCRHVLMDIPSCVDGNFTLLQSSSETAQIVSTSTSLLNNQSVHDVGVGDSNISCWKLYLCTSITWRKHVMMEIPSCVDGTLPDSQAQIGSVTTIMLVCTNSPALTHAQWQFLRRFGHKFGPMAFRDVVFDLLTRSLQTADHTTCWVAMSLATSQKPMLRG